MLSQQQQQLGRYRLANRHLSGDRHVFARRPTHCYSRRPQSACRQPTVMKCQP